MKKQKSVPIPEGYSIESVRYIDHKIVVFMVKDKKLKNGIEKIVPVRVIQGL